MANRVNLTQTIVNAGNKSILLTNVDIPEDLLTLTDLPDILQRIKRMIMTYYEDSVTYEVTGSYELVQNNYTYTTWKGSFAARKSHVPCIEEFKDFDVSFVDYLTRLLSNREYIEQKLRDVGNRDTKFSFVRLFSIILNIQGVVNDQNVHLIDLKFPKKHQKRNFVSFFLDKIELP